MALQWPMSRLRFNMPIQTAEGPWDSEMGLLQLRGRLTSGVSNTPGAQA